MRLGCNFELYSFQAMLTLTLTGITMGISSYIIWIVLSRLYWSFRSGAISWNEVGERWFVRMGSSILRGIW